jgi:hypothetical protein
MSLHLRSLAQCVGLVLDGLTGGRLVPRGTEPKAPVTSR